MYYIRSYSGGLRGTLNQCRTPAIGGAADAVAGAVESRRRCCIVGSAIGLRRLQSSPAAGSHRLRESWLNLPRAGQRISDAVVEKAGEHRRPRASEVIDVVAAAAAVVAAAAAAAAVGMVAPLVVAVAAADTDAGIARRQRTTGSS